MSKPSVQRSYWRVGTDVPLNVAVGTRGIFTELRRWKCRTGRGSRCDPPANWLRREEVCCALHRKRLQSILVRASDCTAPPQLHACFCTCSLAWERLTLSYAQAKAVKALSFAGQADAVTVW